MLSRMVVVVVMVIGAVGMLIRSAVVDAEMQAAPPTSVTVLLTPAEVAAVTAAIATGHPLHPGPQDRAPIAVQPTTVAQWAQAVVDRAANPLLSQAQAQADEARQAKLKALTAAQCAALAAQAGLDRIPGCGGGQ